jgi:addiction module RelE/StbE family toxin
MALADRDAIMVFIAQDNPTAAIDLDLEFEAKAENARLTPKLYNAGRVKGIREIVVRPTYVMIYRVVGDVVDVLRVLHAAQQWPCLCPTRLRHAAPRQRQGQREPHAPHSAAGAPLTYRSSHACISASTCRIDSRAA